MSYRRRALGQGPITDPSQVDDSIILEHIPPTRVDCDALPADSPFRRAGQPCAPNLWDYLKKLIAGAPAPTPTTASPEPSAPTSPAEDESHLGLWLLLGGAAAGAYYLSKKRRK